MNGIGLSGEGHGIFWARRNLVAAVVAAIFVFIAMLAMASPALADSFVVTTTEDTPAADAAVCDSNCSLREAVKLANSNAVADTITFHIPDAGPHTITLTKGQIFFFTTEKITLDGTGESVTVSGNNASRVFNVSSRGNLTVKRLTVSEGNAGARASGGGILVEFGNLAVIDSTVSGNTAAVSGGGIDSATNLSGTSTTTIENSTISGNTVTDNAGRGGGIYNYRGRTTITSSTITKNYAPSLYQSTGGGAGVASAGDTSTETVVANSIISDNSSNCSSGSVCAFQHDGDVDFVSGGLAPHNSFTSQGYNIIGDSSREYDGAYGTAGTAIDAFNKTGDQKGVTDPKLGSLQDNGGRTQTHALLTDSPAINMGSTTLATDQRGVSRPQGAAADVGAFELEIAVNDAPVATDDTAETDEDTAKDISVLGNDTDVDGDSLSISSVGSAGHGTVTNNNDGTINYMPNANYNGPDSFSYTVSDGNGGTDTADVSITVTAVNDAPDAVNDSATTAEDTATDINVLTNDTDVEGDSLSVSGFSQGTNGTVSENDDGTLKYMPNANFFGSDSFTYKANDGSLASNTATVNITVAAVNDAPTAAAQSVTTNEDTGKQITLGANDVDGDALTYSIVSAPAHGTLSGTGANQTYTPDLNYNGSDSFTYKVNDGTVDSNEATVSITVNAVNDASTVTLASGGSCSTSATSVSGTMNLSLADVDSSVDPLTLSATSSNQALVPAANIKLGGSGANRTVSIAPAAKKSGSATITITASDGTAKSSPTTIQVIVGTDQKETIGGTSGADMIFGLNGDDTINARESNDLVCGGNAGGVISGGAGDDTLDGGNGNDVLRGDAGKDIVRGSAGNDTLTGGSEADSFDGGSGTDVAKDYNAAEENTRTNIP
jgi:CSLREA domain-containing protein